MGKQTDGLWFSIDQYDKATELREIDKDGKLGRKSNYTCDATCEIDQELGKAEGFCSDVITVTFDEVKTDANTDDAVRQSIVKSKAVQNILGSTMSFSGAQKGIGGGANAANISLGGSGGMSLLKLLIPESADAIDGELLSFKPPILNIDLDTDGHEPDDETVELTGIKVGLKLDGDFKVSDDDGDCFFVFGVMLKINNKTLVDQTLRLGGESKYDKNQGDPGKLYYDQIVPKVGGAVAPNEGKVKEDETYAFSFAFETVLPPNAVTIRLQCLNIAYAVSDISIPVLDDLTDNRTRVRLKKMVLTLDPQHGKIKAKPK